MPAFGTKALLPLALSVMVAVAASAQAPKCSIDENKFGKDVFTLQLARNAKTPEDAQKQLRTVMKDLSTGDQNPAERNYMIGQTLNVWLAQPTGNTTYKRSELGYTTNPDANVDIVAAIDTAYANVLKAKPECANELTAMRRTQAWAKLVNAAYERANAGALDTAELFAHRALMLDPTAPYGHEVLAIVAQGRQQVPAAIAHWQEAVKAAGTDTSFNDVRQRSLLNIGMVAAAAADTAKGEARATLAGEARDAYTAIVTNFPSTPAADAARRGLVDVALATNDTASLRATYKDVLANPSAADYGTLLNAGVTASRAGQAKDALALFQAAYAKNGYHRDVLYDLGRTYVDLDQSAAALPVVARLLQVDPSNGDNYRLYGLAYATLQRHLTAASKAYGQKANAAKGAAAKRAYIDSAKVVGDSIRLVTDLALKYSMAADSMPAKVSFTEFTPGAGKVTVGGTVTNNTAQPQSYTVTMDFLDKDGNVVTTQTANVGPVAPQQAGKFQLVGAGSGIVAFRYAPVAKVPVIK